MSDSRLFERHTLSIAMKPPKVNVMPLKWIFLSWGVVAAFTTACVS